MQKRALVLATTIAVVALGAGTAQAGTMHPVLGAKLTGMGEHGIVNFQSMATKGRLCWTFALNTKGVTGASIRDAAGMVVAKLGSGYAAKSCAAVAKKALGRSSRPASCRRWTRRIPGDLRGKLFVGMAHM
jgi:hypothetical protein